MTIELDHRSILEEEYRSMFTLEHRLTAKRAESPLASYLAVSLRSRRPELKRPYGVAAERRCKITLVPPSDEKASDIGVSLWPSRSEGVSQRLRAVSPVRSLPCTARPMITFITSFELQMYPNVSNNSMWYSIT
ncbi:hypothetical protein DY000_02007637 [Brassica cretica]|uniref:Uncharacterized protein n=1 Tax=Brassica cretica TaxID=69181 RepID=A0ABQ7CLU2_BRACR|nr:hypothetical protein DY000_02007637 [Brassica cretica]